jgi:hypothetical protein
MKTPIVVISFLIFNTILLPAQTEGWFTACLNDSPILAELMIDACGNDEFYSEYIIVRTQNAIFNTRNFQMRVENPANGAFVGSVTVIDSSTNQKIIDTLNKRGVGSCVYGISFRDAFTLPYNGFIPANSPVLIFNNKNNTDITNLNDRALSALCGSKVFVIFGTLRPQSPGQPVFRNFPPNNSCGNSGCLREIKLSYDNNRYCQNLIYDIKKVAHPNVNDPNAAFLGGGYIRTTENNAIVYGSDNVSNTSGCMPPLSMLCRIPPLPPDYGNEFWNILVFDGLNDFSTRSFKGFYQTKDYDLSAGSFEFNTARQGWKPFEKPSEAHPTYGAMAAYNGCEVKADSFSYLAKRRGFPCGFYRINLARYDDYARIRIDANGDGTFEFDQSYNPPACRTGCNSEIWQGHLGYSSRMEIWSYDIDYEAQIHLIFNKIKNNTQAINISYSVTPSVCNGSTGSLSVNITGGMSPYSLSWSNGIPSNYFSKNNLIAGVYTLTVTDAVNCQDSARIFIPQLNNITLTALKDTAFCAGGVVQLRGVASGGAGNISYEWTQIDGQYISNQSNTPVLPSFSTSYTLKATDMQGCFKTDTIAVKVHTLPLIRFETINDNRDNSIVCNNNVVLKPHGANRYCWSGLPKSVESAFNIPPPYCQNDSDTLIVLTDKLLKIESPFALSLRGIDEKGCENIFTNPSIILKSNKITKKDTVLNETICAGDSLFFNNKWHKTTGKDSILMKTSQGCDSVVYLNLNVKPVIIRTIIDSTCNVDYAGRKDTTYITYQNGCDSLITITEMVWSSRSIKMYLEIVKPISCANKNDGSVGVRNIIGGNPPYTYIWNTRDTTPFLKNLKKGTYTLQIWDNNDCSVIEQIEIVEPPPLSWEVVVISPACNGHLWGQMQINKITGGFSPYSIRVGIFNYKDILTYPFRIDSIRTGKTDVFITDKNGCKMDTSFIIPNASKLLLSLDNRTIALGDSLKIDIKVDYPVAKAQWQPSKGLLCDTCLTTYVKPSETTKYKLTLTDKNGCTTSDEMMVYVEKERHVYAPTVFSPTHMDIRNQRFILYANREVERFKRMQIFNRWGSLIYTVDDFKSGDLSKGWDGTWQGRALAPDVFIYYATIIYIDGTEEVIMGDVTLKK